jgi:hypothetical protein
MALVMRLISLLEYLLLIVGIVLILLGVFSLPLIAYAMNLIVVDSGWPYWPPVTAPPRNFERVLGVFGLMILEIYKNNILLIIIGSILLVLYPITIYLESKLFIVNKSEDQTQE